MELLLSQASLKYGIAGKEIFLREKKKDALEQGNIFAAKHIMKISCHYLPLPIFCRNLFPPQTNWPDTEKRIGEEKR
jgi:hypothetical protein